MLCCRTAVGEASIEEYWTTVRAKLSSLQQQPGSSAQAKELGAAIESLKALVAHAEEDDDPLDDLAVEDRQGMDVEL